MAKSKKIHINVATLSKVKNGSKPKKRKKKNNSNRKVTKSRARANTGQHHGQGTANSGGDTG